MNKKKNKSEFAEVVGRLCSAETKGLCLKDRPLSGEPPPSRDEISKFVGMLRSVLFPGYFGKSDLTPESLPFHIGSTLDDVREIMLVQIKRGLCFVCDHMQKDADACPECDAKAADITAKFIARLPSIQRTLTTDVTAAWEGDPAATSPDIAIFCYPGILAVTNYRIAHALHELEVPLLPRIITEHAHSETGIDIHPGAEIGEKFFIDHGTGVVIGETCVIGKSVSLYQGVTLGAKSFPLDAEGLPVKGVPRHPIVHDNVIIYSNATVLGRVTIGRNSVIGGNVWLTKSVPENTLVTQQNATRTTSRKKPEI